MMEVTAGEDARPGPGRDAAPGLRGRGCHPRLNGTWYGAACAAVFMVCVPLFSHAQTPAANPAQPPSVQANPRAGDASDGKAFRILSRITKAIAPSILFEGRIARSVILGRTSSGATSLCANCTDGQNGAGTSAPGASGGAPAAAPGSAAANATGAAATLKGAPAAGSQPPLGYVLVMDTTNLWQPRFEGGGFVYANSEGCDQDDREYAAFPAAGPDTVTGLVGKLLWICSPAAEDRKPPYDAERTFQLLMRRFWTTYEAPIGDSRREPRKTADGEQGSAELRALAKSHVKKSEDWLPRFRPRFDLREGATASALSDAIALFATSGGGFTMILDLRKLESKQAGYFWAPYDHGQRIVLDESDLVVDGGAAENGDYQPDTFVEYPYLVVGGTYARLALSRGQGSPPVQLVAGSCDECPEQAAGKLP